MTLRVLIADDELLARQRLRRLLEDHPDVEIVAECSAGKDTLDAIRSLAPDLVMMDVRMPEMNAFEVMGALGENPVCAVVLVTAHETYALRAFDAHILDYLLKPFDPERLALTLSRVREHLQRKRDPAAAISAAPVVRSPKPPQKVLDRIAVKADGRIALLKLSDIVWVQSSNNYCELHTSSKPYLIRKRLGALAGELPSEQFVQISRSLMVNLEFVREIRPKSHGDYIVALRDGKELIASRNYRSQLLGRMGSPG